MSTLGDGFDNVARYRDTMPERWDVALIKLIDALNVYIRADVAIAQEFLREGDITRAAFDQDMAELEPIRAVLAKLEAHGLDPTLHDLIPPKPLGLDRAKK